jgi:hypothetical protein
MIATALLLVLAAGWASSIRAADTPTAYSPLRGADCINTNRINDWRIVSERAAIVRSGPKHYLVTLKSACPQLSHPPGLIFGSRSNVGADQGRICGGIGENVRSRGQPPCPIQSVSIIDKARFDQLSQEAKRYREKPTAH